MYHNLTISQPRQHTIESGGRAVEGRRISNPLMEIGPQASGTAPKESQLGQMTVSGFTILLSLTIRCPQLIFCSPPGGINLLVKIVNIGSSF
jgi:hypothetical protein